MIDEELCKKPTKPNIIPQISVNSPYKSSKKNSSHKSPQKNDACDINSLNNIYNQAFNKMEPNFDNEVNMLELLDGISNLFTDRSKKKSGKESEKESEKCESEVKDEFSPAYIIKKKEDLFKIKKNNKNTSESNYYSTCLGRGSHRRCLTEIVEYASENQYLKRYSEKSDSDKSVDGDLPSLMDINIKLDFEEHNHSFLLTDRNNEFLMTERNCEKDRNNGFLMTQRNCEVTNLSDKHFLTDRFYGETAERSNSKNSRKTKNSVKSKPSILNNIKKRAHAKFNNSILPQK